MSGSQRRRVLWALAVTFWIMPSVRAARADEFNDQRLRAGEDAYAGKRYDEASDQFKIAAFGSLDNPPLLSECLVRLALAQSAGGRTSAAIATLERFLEVEKRFGAYAKANLPPDIRASFKTLLLSRTSPATITSIPSLAGMIETEEQKIAKLPPAERRKALEAAVRRDPNNPAWPTDLAREALERGDAKDAERWASKALAIRAGDSDALAVRARARASKGDCSGALQDLDALPPEELTKRPELSADRFVCLVDTRNWDAALAVAPRIPESLAARADVASARMRLAAEEQRRGKPAASTAKASSEAPAAAASPARRGAPAPAAPAPLRADDALKESKALVASGRSADAERLLAEAIDANPNSRDLRLELLEVTCLNRDYPRGAAQVPLLAPFTDAEAPSMFYAAVLLYETGKLDEAKVYLQRSQSRVSGPLVDEYTKKIQGTTGSGR